MEHETGTICTTTEKKEWVRISFLIRVPASSPSALAFSLFPTIFDLASLRDTIPDMSRFVTMT